MAPIRPRLTSVLCAGLLLATASTAAAASTIPVDVRVEGSHRTLVATRTVELSSAPIVHDGDPAHACQGRSALGALHAATGGAWAGSWTEGLGYFVSEIRGEAATGSRYFSLWVGNRAATAGLCQTRLHKGDDVLLFVDRCSYDRAARRCRNAPLTPLAIRASRSVRRGRLLTLRVVRYTPGGRALAARGATIRANGRVLRHRTDRHGRLRVRATRAGLVRFRASMAGRVRSAVVSTRIRRR